MKKIIFECIFNVLKKGPYLLDPFYIMYDFAKGQIIASNKVCPNS